jgi:hypothetical protein
MILGIWVCTFVQEELNEVEVGHEVPGACLVQGGYALWDRYSVDVGAPCSVSCFARMSWFMGRVVAGSYQLAPFTSPNLLATVRARLRTSRWDRQTGATQTVDWCLAMKASSCQSEHGGKDFQTA